MTRGDLAARLVAARTAGPPIDEVSGEEAPRDLEEAYAMADRVVEALEASCGRVVGYKIGATSGEGQAVLGLSEPFYGRILQHGLVRADGWEACSNASIEPEIGFVLARELPPRAEAYSRSEVEAAIAQIVPVLEINAPSYANPFAVGGLCLVADNGVTRALVAGPAREWPNAVSPACEQVRLLKNDLLCAEGHAGVVLGDPVNALVWLANHLRRQGRGLRQGDWVASGAMTRHVAIAPGDRVCAEYATLGRVTLRIDPRR